MMSDGEIRLTLSRLELSPSEAAQLLGVAPRTIRRWLDGEDIPGPAEQALRAWIRLHDRNLPWRPDTEFVVQDDQDQIARHRAHAIQLDELLARVEGRGGPRVPWSVDRGRQIATLGPMEVSYYRLANGSFSLANYRRKDGEPDVQRDWEAIEDAAASIAQAMKKDPDYGPVVLVVHDGPALGRVAKQKLTEFEFEQDGAAGCLLFYRVVRFLRPLHHGQELGRPDMGYASPATRMWASKNGASGTSGCGRLYPATFGAICAQRAALAESC